MRDETLETMLSLARLVGASPADVLWLARLVAGDELLLNLNDLTDEAAAEIGAHLRLYATDTERMRQAWWAREVAA